LTSRAGDERVGTPSALRFQRLEIKYLVDRARRTALERDLSALMRPDPYSGRNGTYTIRSLYFDTADYMAYHEKLAGTAVRHKLRVRVYGDTLTAPNARLEVKSRYLNFIHKLAMDVPRTEYKVLQQSLQRRILPPSDFFEDRPGAREFFRIQRQYNMEPKVIVEYRRRAFERRELSRTRVNFDDELQASRNLDLFGPLRPARSLLRCGHSIFEIKVDGVMPFWLHTLISKYDLQNEAISKYCHAVRSEARLSGLFREDEMLAPNA
jgi:SPX domain protein involved in polyphosphate accumulation